jgi:hypothetical protein
MLASIAQQLLFVTAVSINKLHYVRIDTKEACFLKQAEVGFIIEATIPSHHVIPIRQKDIYEQILYREAGPSLQHALA